MHQEQSHVTVGQQRAVLLRPVARPAIISYPDVATLPDDPFLSLCGASTQALSCKVQQCDEMTQRSDAERDRMREEVILAQAQLADERQAQDAICTRLSDQLAKQNIAIVKLRYMMIDRDSALARKDKELAALRDQVVTITAAHAIEKAALQTAHAVALDSMVTDHKAERAQLRGTVANLKALLKQERREKDTECAKLRDQLALMKTLMRNAMEDAVKILPSVIVDKVCVQHHNTHCIATSQHMIAIPTLLRILHTRKHEASMCTLLSYCSAGCTTQSRVLG